MGFREKIAWLMLGTMLVAYAVYFGITGPRVGFGEERMIDIVWAFAPVAIAHALAMIVGSIAIAVHARKVKADERDRAIARSGAIYGFYALMAGLILVGVAMPFTEPPWKIVNTALLAIVLSQIVYLAVVLISYRRGWHG